MKVAIVYVFPANSGESHVNYAFRFVACYGEFPPGIEHQSIVVLNGAKATSECTCMFSSLENCTFLEHDDSGWDIGAYQYAASKVDCDLMVFLGGSTYMKHAGWLLRIVQSFQKHGNGIYGSMGNRGDRKFNVYPHIRTTGFWMSPEMMNKYPYRVTNPSQRYSFEHGQACISEWVKHQGLPVLVVSWTGEYEWSDWDNIRNGFHRGDQSNLIIGDRLTEPPFYPVP